MTDARLTDDGDTYVTSAVRWRDDYTPPQPGESTCETNADRETIEDLRRALDAIQAVNWHDVPGVSAATAAAFARLLDLAIPEEVSSE